MEEKEIRQIIREAFEQILSERRGKKKISKKKKADRCIKIAKRKYNRWPSAYASGAVVQCRAGEIWKGLKGESVEKFGTLNEVYEEWSRPILVKEDCLVTENLKYHIDNGISLSECVFRYGSEEYFNLISEAKYLFENDIIDLNENDEFITSEHDEDFCVLNGEKIKLNFIFEEVEDQYLLSESEGEPNGFVTTKKVSSGRYEVFVDGKYAGYIEREGEMEKGLFNSYNSEDKKFSEWPQKKSEALLNFGKVKPKKEYFIFYNGNNLMPNKSFASPKKAEDHLAKMNVPQSFLDKVEIKSQINEAEYQGKKVQVGKPKRGGSKKFYVYVRNPKTGKIKKVSFGAKSGGGNLAVKLKDPKARKRFADRHNCEQKNDRTTPGYWSCRLPRYAKQLGLSGGGKWW